MDIKGLLADLSAQNVKSFKGYGIEVTFKDRGVQSIVSQWTDQTAQPATAGVTTTSTLPDDPAFAQQIDAEIAYDKVLNWSASPDASEPETPLTGDSSPLTNQG